MAETGETHRTGGSSTTGARSSSIRLESDAVKADLETEWTLVARRRRFRSKTPDPAVVEATEKALDSLSAHGVVEDMKGEDATKFKSLTTP